MAVPKRKTSKSRKARRQANKFEKAVNTVKCKHCGTDKLSHRVCKACGKY